MRKTNALRGIAVLALVLFESTTAEQPDATRIEKVERQLQGLRSEKDRLAAEVRRLERDLDDVTSRVEHVAISAMLSSMPLFGVFCALWAQNRRRNAWRWFFLGFFLGVFAGIMMLYRNFMDRLSEDIAKTTERLKRSEG